MAKNESIGSFLLQEYQHIAQAHFKGNESISQFFRYYLLIAAVPLSLFIGLYDLGGANQISGANFHSIQAQPGSLSANPYWLATLFLFAGGLGMLICGYIIQQRFDVILYARQVNLIRRYFYDKSDEDFISLQHLSMLPKSGHEPPYFEVDFFLPVIGTFAFLNSAYAAVGISLIESELANNTFHMHRIWSHSLTALSIGILFHIGFYFWFARRREVSYLRRNGIGVDIDGVLGDHAQHFCNLLGSQKNSVAIKPDQIQELPVHRNEDLGITLEQERSIFRNHEYWTTMPVLSNASSSLQEIRAIGIPVYVVTNRPWPEHGITTSSETKLLTMSWRKSIAAWLENVTYRGRWLEIIRLRFRTMREIEILTRAWLKMHGFQIDGLVVERKSWQHFARSAFSSPLNRFELARRKKLKYFVEDDPINAAKLALICEVVFLIEQPYNAKFDHFPDPFGEQPFSAGLPRNVIRVKDWRVIYQLIRRLS